MISNIPVKLNPQNKPINSRIVWIPFLEIRTINLLQRTNNIRLGFDYILDYNGFLDLFLPMTVKSSQFSSLKLYVQVQRYKFRIVNYFAD